jgi:ankyrin repeat protein
MTDTPRETDPASAIRTRVFDAAAQGDATVLAELLDAHPSQLLARAEPYGMTLLHTAAQNGRLDVVDLLLARGLDVNTRETGDNTCAMHWAAAAGNIGIVRRLADAGGDVIGHGDDHQLGVIGWATCWDECDDDAHRAVAELLVARGARHHIFSAIAVNVADEVRRIVAREPSALSARMSRNENNQLPLHFAVRMNRPEMVALLLELGADPLGVDGSGQSVAVYASVPGVDRPVMEAIHRMTRAELLSADRGHRAAVGRALDLVAALTLADWHTALRLVRDDTGLLNTGALHIAARRDDVNAVQWLLVRGADPNARWSHWGASVTPLHLAAWQGHAAIVRMLLDAGADRTIRDTQHDGDALGWAQHGGQVEVVRILSREPG